MDASFLLDLSKKRKKKNRLILVFWKDEMVKCASLKLRGAESKLRNLWGLRRLLS
jgi:hypothetical protein